MPLKIGLGNQTVSDLQRRAYIELLQIKLNLHPYELENENDVSFEELKEDCSQVARKLLRLISSHDLVDCHDFLTGLYDARKKRAEKKSQVLLDQQIERVAQRYMLSAFASVRQEISDIQGESIIHRIWVGKLLSEEKLRAMRFANLQLARRWKWHGKKLKVRHILWTENKMMLTYAEKFVDLFEVRDVNELFDNPDALRHLRPAFLSHMAWKEYSYAADIAKVLAVYLFGGLYLDAGFENLHDKIAIKKPATEDLEFHESDFKIITWDDYEARDIRFPLCASNEALDDSVSDQAVIGLKIEVNHDNQMFYSGKRHSVVMKSVISTMAACLVSKNMQVEQAARRLTFLSDVSPSNTQIYRRRVGAENTGTILRHHAFGSAIARFVLDYDIGKFLRFGWDLTRFPYQSQIRTGWDLHHGIYSPKLGIAVIGQRSWLKVRRDMTPWVEAPF
ncbi:hypothetical protein [Pelagibaculum spongiae]|uniref:GT44 domain-containing protein n=1 Tax=Pelagibaculum spongiae TaxID=2080658 RepID=A0A2V1GVY5_9GAMM|nr:hypothetical protein [Pelagibaculum spongiae]PVZ64326.1 hypothetical protein DC094_19880 [Pelagibaculum spongiae]